MHMADALLSPQVGGVMWGVTGAVTIYAAGKVKKDLDERRVPLMGVLAAFVFAAQMINFTIPGTGSSGHLGGGLLLAVLLGPHAGFLAIASVLVVQALFFADGGLLALGCNIFNMGAVACYVAYPLVYRKIVGGGTISGARLLWGALLAAVAGLQLGALGVVLETTLSGVSELPFASFLVMMQPIHLAIGVVEGLVTAGIVSFIWKTRPEILGVTASDVVPGALPVRKVLVTLALATVVTGGLLSWFASEHPDGLEWSMLKVSGKEELPLPENRVHSALEKIQEKTAFMPDYGFPADESIGGGEEGKGPVDLGTSAAGILGGVLVLLLGLVLGFGLKKRTAAGQRA
ncbi:MAG: energy-coupling factor ABC transporter permease [Desulfobulbaceae bacterium]